VIPPNIIEFDTDNEALERALKKAYKEQALIGWNHFALGRIAKSWKDCFLLEYTKYPYPEAKSDAAMRSMIESLWSMMLNTRRRRNDVEHGDNMVYSRQDIKMITEIVNKIYIEVLPIVKNDDKWLFEKPKKKETKVLW